MRKHSKWQRWFGEICADVGDLLAMKYVYYETGAVITGNPALQRPSVFYDFLATAYSTAVLMGVRRQVKSGRDSISLVRLLEEMERRPEEMTRGLYRELHSGRDRDAVDAEFDLFAGRGKDVLDRSIVSNDISRLRALAARCEHYVDRRLAHLDSRGIKAPPRYRDLNDCIDLMDDILVRYQRLFSPDFREGFTPAVQDGWKDIFREPWLRG